MSCCFFIRAIRAIRGLLNKGPRNLSAKRLCADFTGV
jgi:hypothetical protein